MPAGPPLSALIVDDDPSACGVFSRLLTRLGYSVQVLDNGEAALELVKTRAYDVCLIDKQLPGAGGISVARAIRSHMPDAVVIFITGFATASSADELVGIADEYLTKPFDLDTLRETVSTLVERRRGQYQGTPSPAPLRERGKKWVHLSCADTPTCEGLAKVCEQLGAQVTVGVSLPAQAPDVLVVQGKVATFELRKALWGFQSRKPDLQVVLLTDPGSAADSAAAVALKAGWRITLPTRPEQASLVLAGALGERLTG